MFLIEIHIYKSTMWLGIFGVFSHRSSQRINISYFEVKMLTELYNGQTYEIGRKGYYVKVKCHKAC